mmetsp:Transcript_3251/g.9561  ORF Transcript_3251/g.9561 Transcript_3251/m.9561 type:complete len:178 (-) Transcript_3251:40-573(-)
MPSKKKGEAQTKSKKAIAEAKRIRATDQTFGIKNKNKGAKAKAHVAKIEQGLLGNERKANQKRQEDKKARRALREQEAQMERALFSETTDVLLGDKKKAPATAEAAADELGPEIQKALARAKELFDAGAMTMEDYVNYREQILAPDSDDDESDGGADESSGGEEEAAEEEEGDEYDL